MFVGRGPTKVISVSGLNVHSQLGNVRSGVELIRVGLVQDGHHGRLAHRLQIKDGHEGERVARDGLLTGVVDSLEFGPAFDVQYERLHAPVPLTVRFQQMGVPDADVVVQVDVTVDLTGK